MVDTLTAAERSERMSRVKGKGNASTELRLIILFRLWGITGWRRGSTILGKPDVIFRDLKIAVFVDGCFWHGCPRHRRIPKSRVEFWSEKLAGNERRDRLVSRQLRAKGWKVLRIWECDLTPSRWVVVARRLRKVMDGRIAERATRESDHSRLRS